MSPSSLSIIMQLVSVAPELVKTFQKVLDDPAVKSAEELLSTFFDHNDPSKPNNPKLGS